ncbi:GNAT family N-acetyltransferase [Streptomyces sp. NBC_01387]|uniref:GNAT family N-acetyltransferase n=1 Tax=Streptomyces sp. NBC_01387 TaxID=2903849 RepID=UPI00386DE1CB
MSSCGSRTGARSECGRGLAAVVHWAFGDLQIPRLELYVEPWNTASARTAERVGFRREGLLRSWQQVGEERRDRFMYAMTGVDLSWPAAGRRLTSAAWRPSRRRRLAVG